MVPSHFNQQNVNKLLKLLETGLNHIGRLFYSIGYPLYFIIYRSYSLLDNLTKTIKSSSEKQKLKQKILTTSSKNKSIIELKVRLLVEDVFGFLTTFKKYFIKDIKDLYSLAQQAYNKLIILYATASTLFQNPYKLIKKQSATLHKQINSVRAVKLKNNFKTINNRLRSFISKSSTLSSVISDKKNEVIKVKLTQIQQHLYIAKKRLSQKINSINKSYDHKLKKLKSTSKKHYINKRILFLENLQIFKNKLHAKRKNIVVRRFSKKKLTAYAVLGIIFAVMATIITMWYSLFNNLPSAQVLAARDIKASTKIYDRNGVLLYKIYKDENRTPVSLSEVPVHVKHATLAIEDSEFYSHPGFSVRGMTRAIIRNYQRGELTGGSTITQQLVKNTLLTPEKTMTRKLKEIVLAVEVEMNYTKDEILEMYLNEVSYGGTAYGIEEAATMYFDKSVQELTLAEAALLAGLPKSPTDYSPFGNNPQSSVDRRLEVLRLMEENGFINHEERIKAQQEQLTFTAPNIDIKAPHFVMYVREQLEEKYGKEMVEQGGLEVYTTLDYETQLAAEKVVKEEVDRLSRLNVGNGAAIVMSPSSGEILAMVGSKDYFDYENDGNVNVTTSLRQPGSSIKIVNYAYALSNGLTPATIIDDSPATFLIKGSPPYQPRNYDGRYRGRITLRSALAESRNVPAVKILNSYGVDNMIELGKKLGISTWEDKNRFGLSLTLGGGEVMLTDLAQVYATMANYGRNPNVTSVLKVTDYKGNVLDVNECESEERSTFMALADKLSDEVSASQSAVKLPFNDTTCEGEKVLDPRVAYMITDILKDNEARSPAFGRNSLLNIPGHPEVAVKTGTSNSLRDNLTVGYNQNYLVAVWVGNNDNTPMSRVASGITGASPIFNKIMTYLLADQPSTDWITPNGLVKLDICPYTGTLSCSGCPAKSEWFLEEDKPEQQCKKDWFDDDKEDKDNEDDNTNNDRGNNRVPGWIRDRINN